MNKSIIAITALSTLCITKDTCKAVVVLPTQSATITDENGDGVPDVIGLGYGHPDDPNYGTTLVQKSPGYERRSVEDFSFAGVSSVQSATLTFSFYNSIGTSYTFETFLASGDGQVQLTDFSFASSSLGARTVPGNQVYFISYDVTPQLNSLLSGGATFVSVRQQIVGSIGGSQVYSPQFNFTAIPEPNTVVLIVLGIGSFFYASKHRARKA